MTQEFVWNYFEKTGSVEAYLTYKSMNSAKEAVSDKDEDKPTGTDN